MSSVPSLVIVKTWHDCISNGYLMSDAAPDLLTNYEREPKGIPIGRAPTVNLRNNHTQYIFTW